MEPKIKKGDKIRIKENLMEELVKVGFNRSEMESFVERFKGTEQTAYDVYFDAPPSTGEWFATVEMCCEIPLSACELINPKSVSKFKDTPFKESNELIDQFMVENNFDPMHLQFYMEEKYGIAFPDDGFNPSDACGCNVED